MDSYIYIQFIFLIQNHNHFLEILRAVDFLINTGKVYFLIHYFIP